MKHISTLIAILWLNACATSQEKIDVQSEIQEANGITVISNHPDVINSYLQPNGNQHMLCLEPDPDVASTFNGSLSLGANIAGNNDTISGSDGSSAVSTGGLSPMVLIAREMLYRACELSMNSNANAEQQLAIYKMFLDSIEKLSGVDLGTGTTASQPTGQ
ncbi:hypothetical protein ACFODZ_06040 [Marinicella sediminis]|uniref:Uncharacterized protein n=1 Tax=Marinicella sediminis TaxID=1792834 RepID=A0ABV7JA93_9GAMM|nr:hypothetical protein [Marinicella sediminis]